MTILSRIDIAPFCDRAGTRSDLQKPMRHGAHVVATDRHILVMIEAPDGDYPRVSDSIAEAIARMEEEPYAGLRIAMMDLALPDPIHCRFCDGNGHAFRIICDECDGDGEFVHGSHWYECKACDGNGYVIASHDCQEAERVVCNKCGGYGEEFLSVRVGETHYQRKYLALLKSLPNCQLEPNAHPEGAARFTFDGGRGYLMPCRGGV